MSRITTTDQFEAAYREGIGRPLPLKPWRTVTAETLWRFGEGIGDHNPLYCDEAYAREARFGDLVASPTYLYSLDVSVVGAIYGHIPVADLSTKDLTLLYLGADIEWHRPIWVGDRVRTVETPVDCQRMSTPQVPDGLKVTSSTEYWNSRGELIATLTTHMLRFPNSGKAVAPSAGEEPVGLAPDPLVWSRERRGGRARLWSDVTVGDVMEDLPKGTYTMTELYLFSYVAQNTQRTRTATPGVLDTGAAGRADAKYAREHRAQASNFDWGPQRVCWAGQIVTDWMGDWGRLHKLSTKIRRPNLVGDVNTLRGRVVDTSVEQDRHLVTLEVEVVNHTGAVTATGTALVELPATEPSVPQWRGEAGIRTTSAGGY